MERALKVLNELQKSGIINDYAIGGGIAVAFYIEPVVTYDLDIFYITSYEENGLIALTSIYDWLRKRGYRESKEQVEIEGILVQFIPVYNKLIKEGLENAIEKRYKRTKTKILKAEYLIAIMLETYRPKDRERIVRIIDEADIDIRYTKQILKRHGLIKKFEHFMKLYYEK